MVDTTAAATPTGGTSPAALSGWSNESRIDGQATPSIESGRAMLKKAR